MAAAMASSRLCLMGKPRFHKNRSILCAVFCGVWTENGNIIINDVRIFFYTFHLPCDKIIETAVTVHAVVTVTSN